MDFLRTATWAEALDTTARHPDATPIAGGTGTGAPCTRIIDGPGTRLSGLPGGTGTAGAPVAP